VSARFDSAGDTERSAPRESAVAERLDAVRGRGSPQAWGESRMRRDAPLMNGATYPHTTDWVPDG